MNKWLVSISLIIFLLLGQKSMAQFQLPPIDLRLAGGYHTYAPFGYFYVGDDSRYKLDTFTAGIGADIWLTRSISIGFLSSLPAAATGEYNYQPTDEWVDIVYDASYHTFRASYSSNSEGLFSVYGGVGFHYMQHYYEDYNYGRKSNGVSGNLGLVFNVGKIRINAVEANVIYVNQSLFSEAHEAILFFTLSSGISIRVYDPR